MIAWDDTIPLVSLTRVLTEMWARNLGQILMMGLEVARLMWSGGGLGRKVSHKERRTIGSWKGKAWVKLDRG